MMISIRTKIFLTLLFPSLVLLSVIYINHEKLSSLGASPGLMLSRNYRSIKAAQQVRQHLDEKQNEILRAWLQGTNADDRSITFLQHISALLKTCKDNITEEGEKQIVDRILAHYESYVHWFTRWLQRADHGGEAWPSERNYEFISLTGFLISDLNDLVLINEKAMEVAEQEARQMAGEALSYSLGLFIATILLTTVFSYIVSSRISGPLIGLARSLAGVKEGTGEYPRIPLTTRDEIGFLAGEFNKVFERLKAHDEVRSNRLSAETRKARKAEDTKAQFMADLSHQLKTPMTSLSMSIGILSERLNELPSPSVAQLVETAREDCGRLSSLINELLDISRIDAMLKPRPREVLDVEKVVHESLEPLLNQASEKGVRIDTEIEVGLPAVAIDSLRFPWVITNLAGNAIRYTDRGGRVLIRVERRGQRLYFQCSDNGSGIDEKYLPMIFDRFTQFAERGKRGVIGLGLAIVKEVIEDQGGDIRVESSTGKGTTFTFWIPIQTGEDAR